MTSPARKYPALISRGLAAAAAVTLLATVAACSSSASGPGAAHSTPASSSGSAQSAGAKGTTAKTTSKKDVIAGLITFKGKLQFSGAHHSHASFHAFPGVTSPKSSCAKIASDGTPGAKGEGPDFRIPAPALGGNITFSAEIKPYHGPGTYQKSSIVAVGASIAVGNDSYSLLGSGTTVTVTFKANGSGALTFRDATAAKASDAPLSGTIQWTCEA